MLRLILPQLIWTASLLLFLLIGSQFLRKNVEREDWEGIVPWIWRLAFLIVVIFAIWIVNILSVNEVPRSVIDRSGGPSNGSFESRMEKDTITK